MSHVSIGAPAHLVHGLGRCLPSPWLAYSRSWTVNAIGAHGEKKEDLLQAVSSPLSLLQASPFPQKQTPSMENFSLGT